MLFEELQRGGGRGREGGEGREGGREGGGRMSMYVKVNNMRVREQVLPGVCPH